MIRLVDLEPRWYSRGQPGNRIGITFRCPCCPDSGQRLAIAVHLDGTNFDPDPANPQQWGAGDKVWTVTGGDSFENISLSPSIDASPKHWHGFITNGVCT